MSTDMLQDVATSQGKVPTFDRPVYFRKEVADLLATTAQTLWRYEKQCIAEGKHLWVARRGWPRGSSRSAAYHPYQVALIYAVVWTDLKEAEAENAWTAKLAEIQTTVRVPNSQERMECIHE